MVICHDVWHAFFHERSQHHHGCQRSVGHPEAHSETAASDLRIHPEALRGGRPIGTYAHRSARTCADTQIRRDSPASIRAGIRRRGGAEIDAGVAAVREFFDTSTLLAAMVEDEPGHEAALARFTAATDGYAATHSMAECFATLTSGRLPVRVPPALAAEMVEINVSQRLNLWEHDPQIHADSEQQIFLPQRICEDLCQSADETLFGTMRLAAPEMGRTPPVTQFRRRPIRAAGFPATPPRALPRDSAARRPHPRRPEPSGLPPSGRSPGTAFADGGWPPSPPPR